MKSNLALTARFLAMLGQRARRCKMLVASCRDCRVRKGVHRLRIQARRLLACLDLAGDALSRRRRRKSRAKLKTILRAVGPVRDAKVQQQLLATLAPDHPDGRLLARNLRLAEQQSRRAATFILKTIRLGRTLRHLRRSLPAPAGGPAGDARRRQEMIRILTQAQRRLVRRWPRSTADRDVFHRARVALKRYRYQLEVLDALTAGLEPGALDRLRLIQHRLGELHDCEVLLAWLQSFSDRETVSAELRRFLVRRLRRRAAHLRRACLIAPPTMGLGRALRTPG